MPKLKGVFVGIATLPNAHPLGLHILQGLLEVLLGVLRTVVPFPWCSPSKTLLLGPPNSVLLLFPLLLFLLLVLWF